MAAPSQGNGETRTGQLIAAHGGPLVVNKETGIGLSTLYDLAAGDHNPSKRTLIRLSVTYYEENDLIEAIADELGIRLPQGMLERFFIAEGYQKIAAKIGVSPTTVMNWARGQQVGHDSLEKLAEAYPHNRKLFKITTQGQGTTLEYRVLSREELNSWPFLEILRHAIQRSGKPHFEIEEEIDIHARSGAGGTVSQWLSGQHISPRWLNSLVNALNITDANERKRFIREINPALDKDWLMENNAPKDWAGQLFRAYRTEADISVRSASMWESVTQSLESAGRHPSTPGTRENYFRDIENGKTPLTRELVKELARERNALEPPLPLSERQVEELIALADGRVADFIVSGLRAGDCHWKVAEESLQAHQMANELARIRESIDTMFSNDLSLILENPQISAPFLQEKRQLLVLQALVKKYQVTYGELDRLFTNMRADQIILGSPVTVTDINRQNLIDLLRTKGLHEEEVENDVMLFNSVWSPPRQRTNKSEVNIYDPEWLQAYINKIELPNHEEKIDFILRLIPDLNNDNGKTWLNQQSEITKDTFSILNNKGFYRAIPTNVRPAWIINALIKEYDIDQDAAMAAWRIFTTSASSPSWTDLLKGSEVFEPQNSGAAKGLETRDLKPRGVTIISLFKNIKVEPDDAQTLLEQRIALLERAIKESIEHAADRSRKDTGMQH